MMASSLTDSTTYSGPVIEIGWPPSVVHFGRLNLGMGSVVKMFVVVVGWLGLG